MKKLSQTSLLQKFHGKNLHARGQKKAKVSSTERMFDQVASDHDQVVLFLNQGIF